MNKLDLSEIREKLIRLEESIIFGLLERRQFLQNLAIYEPGRLAPAGFEGSFLDYMLLETEKVHAQVRRYLSPGEEPFFRDLPEPVLPSMDFESPLHPNKININDKILPVYRDQIIPSLCDPGDCGNYGSSAVCDVTCLQTLSHRIHYGKFVAEAKFRADQKDYEALIKAEDRTGIIDRLTDKAVEARLLERVRLKSSTYGQEPGEKQHVKLDPDFIAGIYEDHIIPLTIEVELLYLLERLS